jgi:hypothetical protein
MRYKVEETLTHDIDCIGFYPVYDIKTDTVVDEKAAVNYASQLNLFNSFYKQPEV